MASSQLIHCPTCGANNRVSAERLAHGEAPVCGRCKAVLPLGGTVVSATDASFAEVVEQSDVPVLLDLWAPWCGPCRMIAPTLEKLAAEYGPRVRIAKINVDENHATAMRFDARSIPLLVLLKQGREVDRIVGVQPANVIKQKLDRVLAAA